MFYWCIDMKIAPDLWYNKITTSNKHKRRGDSLMIYQMSQSELFFMFCEDIQDMELTDALQSLMALFVEHISMLSADISWKN